MLTIRRQQMEIFERHLMDDFVARLTSHFLAEFPDLPAASLADRIRAGVSRAQEFHITRESDVAHFLELLLAYPPDTAIPRDLLPLLTRYGMEPDRKLHALKQWLAGSHGSR